MALPSMWLPSCIEKIFVILFLFCVLAKPEASQRNASETAARVQNRSFSDQNYKTTAAAVGASVSNLQLQLINLQTILTANLTNLQNFRILKTESNLFMFWSNVKTGDGFLTAVWFDNEGNFTVRHVGKLKKLPKIIDLLLSKISKFDILIVAYSTHIQVYQMPVKVVGKNYIEPIQKVPFSGDLEKISVSKINEQHFLLIWGKCAETEHRISLYRWIDSGFHQTDSKTMDHIKKVWILPTDHSGMLSPIILIAAEQSMQRFVIDSNGKIEKFSKKFPISGDRFEPYMIDGSTIRYLTCQRNYCSIREIAIQDSNEYDSNEIEGIDKDGIGLIKADSNHRVISEVSVGNHCCKNCFWKAVYIKGLLLWVNDYQLLGFASPDLNVAIPLNSTVLLSDISDFDVWANEIGSKKFLIIIRQDETHVTVQISELNVVKRMYSSGNSDLKMVADPLTNIIGRLRTVLYSRQQTLEWTSHALQTLDSRHMQHSRTVINSRRIDRLTLKNPSVLLPSTLKERLRIVREKLELYREKKVVKLGLKIHVSRLQVDNLLYSRLLFGGIKFDRSRRQTPITVANVTSNSHNLSGPIQINNLAVKRIGNIVWSEFIARAFVQGRDSLINGQLRVQNGVRIDVRQLQVKLLNDEAFKDVLTLTTEQTITSSLFVSKLLVPVIQAKSLNGYKTTDFAVLGKNNTIKAPVRMKNFAVAKDLTLLTESESDFAEHIRRDNNLENFSQIYNGKVTVTGNVTISDLVAIDVETGFVFENVATNLSQFLQAGKLNEEFWMRNMPQALRTVKFDVPVVVTKLKGKALNQHPLTDYLLLSKHLIDASAPLRFENTTIVGNLNTSSDLNFPPIELLSASLVRKQGHAEIFGRKNFSSWLRTANLKATILNGIRTEDLVHRDRMNFIFTAPTFIRRLRVTDRLSANGRFDINTYNLHDMVEYFGQAVHFTSATTRVNSLEFIQEVRVSNLQACVINDIRIEGISGINRHANKSIGVAGHMTIHGKLIIHGVNQLTWNDFVNMLFLSSNRKSIGGKKIISDKLTIAEGLNTTAINELSLRQLFESTLRKKRSQIITGQWVFHDIRVANLSAQARINSIEVMNLIDNISPVKFAGDVVIYEANVKGSVSGRSVPNNSILRDLVNQLRFLNRTVSWRAISVNNDAHWPDNSSLKRAYERIRDRSVRLALQQDINGHVLFSVGPLIRDVQAYQNPANVDLATILRDALLQRNVNSRLTTRILAAKYFKQAMLIDSIKVSGSLDVERLNGIDILTLNRSLSRRNTPELSMKVSSRKVFGKPPILGHLIVSGHVNSLRPEQLVFVGESTKSILLPIQLTSTGRMTTNNLEITRLNQVDLNGFINSRLRLGGGRQETFDFVTFNDLRTERINLTAINGINIDRIVLKHFGDKQYITGLKEFRSPLRLFGPSSISNINGAPLFELFRKSLTLDRNYAFRKLDLSDVGLALDAGLEIVEGNIRASGEIAIQGNVQHLLEKLDVAVRNDHIGRLQQRFERFLYLEYDISAKVLWNSSGKFLREPALYSLKVCDNCSNGCDSLHIELMQPLANDNQFVLQNHTRSDARARFNETQYLSIGFHNNCTLNRSQLYLDYDNVQHRYEFPDSTIANLWSFESSLNSHIEYLLIEFHTPTQGASVSLLRFDANESQLQRIQEFFTANKTNFDPIFTRVGSDKMPVMVFALNRKHVELYEFVSHAERFIRAAMFDVSDCESAPQFSLFSLPDRNRSYQPIIACRGQPTVTAYNNRALPIQQIHLPARNIIEHISIAENAGSNFLVVTTRANYFYVYRWLSDVEGWISETYGFVENLKWTIPVGAIVSTGPAENRATSVFIVSRSDGVATSVTSIFQGIN